MGGSGGGSLALELAGEADLCAIVAGEPASVLFTGLMVRGMSDRGPAFQEVMRNPKKYYTPELQKFTRAKIEQIHCPVLIVHGDIHPLKIINQEIIVPELKAAEQAGGIHRVCRAAARVLVGAMDGGRRAKGVSTTPCDS